MDKFQDRFGESRLLILAAAFAYNTFTEIQIGDTDGR